MESRRMHGTNNKQLALLPISVFRILVTCQIIIPNPLRSDAATYTKIKINL